MKTYRDIEVVMDLLTAVDALGLNHGFKSIELKGRTELGVDGPFRIECTTKDGDRYVRCSYNWDAVGE